MMKLMMRISLISFLGLMALSQAGCASFGKRLKAFLGGKDAPAEKIAEMDPVDTYSANPNNLNAPVRQYKRVTRKDIEEEAALGEKAGSLWTMEGQGAYLFSQNVIRMIGDPISIRMDGEPKEQLESKVGIIKDLLARLEERQKAKLRDPASEDANKEAKPEDAAQKAAADKTAGAEKPGAGNDKFNVRLVPTRVVERLIDGNYRIKGAQPFMIGSREYKVIVTGIVRAEDFSEDGINASKLLDPKFDIVSVRRKDTET